MSVLDEKIKEDARNYARGIGDPKRLDATYYGYIAGATAIYGRAQAILDALDQFISFHESGLLPARHVYENAVVAREQWKEGKEVENEK